MPLGGVLSNICYHGNDNCFGDGAKIQNSVSVSPEKKMQGCPYLARHDS